MKYERIIRNEAEGAKGGVSISEFQNNMADYNRPVIVSKEYIIKVLSERYGLRFSDEDHLDTTDQAYIDLFGKEE